MNMPKITIVAGCVIAAICGLCRVHASSLLFPSEYGWTGNLSFEWCQEGIRFTGWCRLLETGTVFGVGLILVGWNTILARSKE
jgi:hypothetical protein